MLKFIFYSAFFSLTIFLSGCGGEENSGNSKNTQVVAKVNNDEITIHQLNQLLSRVRAPKDSSKEDIEKRVLDRLIEQTLVLQAAKKIELNRKPDIVSAMEEAKNKVLIDHYIQRTLKAVTLPSDEQIQKFYEDFPELFADRKIYVFTKLAISADTEHTEQMIKWVKAGNSIDEITSRLDQQQTTYKKMSEANGEGKLANPILHFLSALQAGDIGYLKMTDGLLVVELHKILDQSVELKEAKNTITRQLLTEARKKASKKLIDSLKENANIEYVGKFAPTEE